MSQPHQKSLPCFAELIAARQQAIGLSDQQLCEALNLAKPSIWALIKSGTLRIPLQNVPTLANALALDAVALLEAALGESMPELLVVIRDHYVPKSSLEGMVSPL